MTEPGNTLEPSMTRSKGTTELSSKELAMVMAQGSIVTKCLARYIEQIIECMHEDIVMPLHKRIEELEAQLKLTQCE